MQKKKRILNYNLLILCCLIAKLFFGLGTVWVGRIRRTIWNRLAQLSPQHKTTQQSRTCHDFHFHKSQKRYSLVIKGSLLLELSKKHFFSQGWPFYTFHVIFLLKHILGAIMILYIALKIPSLSTKKKNWGKDVLWHVPVKRFFSHLYYEISTIHFNTISTNINKIICSILLTYLLISSVMIWLITDSRHKLGSSIIINPCKNQKRNIRML